MTIDQMRELLGLGPEVSDAEVIAAYAAYLDNQAADPSLYLDDFRLRYPEFDAVADETVQYWLVDASRAVDESWIAEDIGPAHMAFAAHELAQRGLGANNETGTLPKGVASFKSGTFSASFSDAQASASGFATTRYGQEFATLRRRSFAGPRIIA